MLAKLKQALAALGSPEKAAHLSRFFKTGPGQYGEGDVFIGVTVPELRSIAKQYAGLADDSLLELLLSPIHEHRLLALFLLVNRYQKADATHQAHYYQFYCDHFSQINNWDLVDQSAHHIVGHFLFEKSRESLHRWIRSEHLWTRRIAMVATWYFIRQKDLSETFLLAAQSLKDQHDLMHKAVGWMLREAGKRDQHELELFLQQYYQKMPRTMLRYAIERFDEPLRKSYLHGSISISSE